MYDEVIAINNIPIQEYLTKKIYQYCWHEKEDNLEWDVNSLIPIVEYKTDIIITTVEVIPVMLLVLFKLLLKANSSILQIIT